MFHTVKFSPQDRALGKLLINGLHGNTGLCLQVESPELAACEGGSTEMATGDGISTEAATVEGASMSADDEATSQALERLESAGNAACCLNDTFEVCSPAQVTCCTVPPWLASLSSLLDIKDSLILISLLQ